MTISEIRLFVRNNIESFAGAKATIQGTMLGGKFCISGMLSSTWEGCIPVCIVRSSDNNSGNVSISFKKIKNITQTSKNFYDEDLIQLGIDLESRGFYKHTGSYRIVFEIELKSGEKVELWINRTEKYASVDNIIAKMEGRLEDVKEL